MTRYSPYSWADDEGGGTPITAARLNALEAGAAADVPVADIDATGTPSGTTYLRGDGTWSTPAGGGGGAVDSVNGDVGTVVLNQDDIGDGTTYKQYSGTEKTKLAGIATSATANSSDATLLARANHTGTQSADTLTDGTTNKAFLATERTKLTGIATSATANDTDANLKARANHTGTQAASTISDFSTAADARIAAVVRYMVPFSQGGTLTTGTGQFRLYNRSGATRTIQTVTASVGTAPTGASILIDVNKNGTTIFTTQSNRPTIAASGFEDESGAPDVTSWAAGDYLTIDIDQVGSTIAGANLTVTVVYS
jgi:hypothetical protein